MRTVDVIGSRSVCGAFWSSSMVSPDLGSSVEALLFLPRWQSVREWRNGFRCRVNEV